MKENYNYIISNIILSKNTFSYNEILDEIKCKFNNDELGKEHAKNNLKGEDE